MKTLTDIHTEIDRASERRAELWHSLAEGHNSQLAAELKELEAQIGRLWDEHRSLKAQVRFGDRDEIIRRARHEERLARAA